MNNINKSFSSILSTIRWLDIELEELEEKQLDKESLSKIKRARKLARIIMEESYWGKGQ